MGESFRCDELSALVLRENHIGLVVEEVQGGYACGPERALMAAMLFDGIQAYLEYVLVDRLDPESVNQEAYAWVHTDGSEYIFSFESCCEALGINPGYLRLGLSNCSQSLPVDWRRSRRTF